MSAFVIILRQPKALPHNVGHVFAQPCRQKLAVLGKVMCSLQRNVTSSECGHLLSFTGSSSCKSLKSSSAQAFLMLLSVSHRSCMIYTAALSLGTYHNGCHMFSAAHEQGDFVPWGINSKRTKICFFFSPVLFCYCFFSKGWTNTWTEANTECNQIRRERCLCPGFYLRLFRGITWIS